jgi:hypothetical protein
LLEPVARKRARPVLRGPGRRNAPRLPDYWAADALAELGAAVHLAHPLGVKAFEYRRVKNDERDAADLADLLRMGRLPEAWIAPPATRELRELVRHRAKLVGLRSHAKAQIHAVLARCGVAVPMSDLFGADGTALLERVQLPAVYRARIASLRRVTRRAGVRDRAVRRDDPGSAGPRPRLHRDPADPRDRAGAGRGVRRRDRRGDPLRRAGAAGQLGRVDPAAPRVRHHRAPRADHQDGMWRPRLRPPCPRVVESAGRSS